MTETALADTIRYLDAWEAGREYGRLEVELARQPARPAFRPCRDRNRASIVALADQHGYRAHFTGDPDGSGWTTLHLTKVADDDAVLGGR